MLCAIATDNGINLMDRHFGDAVQYDLYNFTKDGIIFQETILNPFREEENEADHGEKIKASNMKELFLEKSVCVIVSKRFGPNIKRMVKNFVPVIIRFDDIKNAKELLIENADQIENMFNEGQDRKHIILK